jgi:hypothetical protein
VDLGEPSEAGGLDDGRISTGNPARDAVLFNVDPLQACLSGPRDSPLTGAVRSILADFATWDGSQ